MEEIGVVGAQCAEKTTPSPPRIKRKAVGSVVALAAAGDVLNHH